MIEILQKFSGNGAGDGHPLNKNRFLESLLVEMVTENYRQLVSEALIRSREAKTTKRVRLDPPLRANERVAAALVQTALSRVAIRSRTEGRVERNGGASTGRIDHLAWYANHVIGIELKIARMALRLENEQVSDDVSEGEVKTLARVENPWRSVLEQSASALDTLRNLKQKDHKLYPRPLSLPLMLVVGQRRVQEDALAEMDKNIGIYRKAFIEALPKNSVNYLAVYTAPWEHRVACERAYGKTDREKDGVMYIPFYAFLSSKVG